MPKTFTRNIVTGIVLLGILVVANAIVAYRITRQLHRDAREVGHSYRVLNSLDSIISAAKDAETGHRGFIITNNPDYLKPYNDGIATIRGEVDQLQFLTRDNERQQARIPNIRKHIDNKLAELERSLQMRKEQNFEAAQAYIRNNRGRVEMDALRDEIAALQAEEEELIQQREVHSEQTYHKAVFSGVFAAILSLVAGAAFVWLLRRHLEAKELAADAMQRQSELLRITLESIGDAVIATDRDANVTFLNPVASRLTGWTDSEAVGQPLTTVFNIVNEATRDKVENPALRALKEGVIIGLANHTILIGKGGDEHPIDDSAAPIRDAAGQVIGAVLVFRDISDRKETERQLHETSERHSFVIETCGIGTWLNPLPLGQLVWNKNVKEHFHLPPDAEVTIGTFFERLHPDDRAETQKRIDTAIESHGLFDSEYRTINPANGSEKWVRAVGKVSYSPEGVPLRFDGITLDITRQKLIEEQLRTSEARARAILDSINDGFMTIDRDWRVTYFNLSAERIISALAKTNDNLHGKNFWAEFPATVGTPFETNYRRAMDEQVNVAFEAYYPPLETWFGVRAYHSPAGISVFFLDITESKLVQARLQASDQLFQQVTNTMPQIVWIAKPDGTIDYYNERWYDFTGFENGSISGDSWTPILHPDDVDPCKERWYASVTSGEPYQIEYRFIDRSTGRYRWFLGRALPVRDDSGQIMKWFGTCTDIDDFKHLEEDRQKFVSLAENSTDFIAMSDLDSKPFYVNRAGLRLIGLDTLDEARATHMKDFFFPADQDEMMQDFMPSVLQRGHGEVEVRFRHFKTGHSRWMLYNVFTLTDPQGTRVGLATVSRDITDRRQLEDNLRQLAADLSEADRRKDEFLATLAHELRNPLAPISNGLEVLKRTGSAAPAVEQARTMMERQLGQMVRLVDDLLDVSRITRNKLELRKEHIELENVIRSAVETSRPLIDTLGHELKLELPSSPIMLDADFTRLAQVFANLLNNAAKYTERGGVITLAAVQQGTEVLVMVKDTGVGIPEAMLPKVFDMFTQVDRTLERAQGGLGIGLTLVRRLVEMHGGSVEARSEGYGRGSEFSVRLPILASPESAVVEAKTPAVPNVRRRILVVDDNIDSAESLSMLLGMMGNEMRVAYDGLAAVEAAAEFHPDVILLDIGLPKLNGFEVCRRIRELPSGRRPMIVACTGWGQDEDRRRSQDAGFDFHLTKPVDLGALERLLSGE